MNRLKLLSFVKKIEIEKFLQGPRINNKLIPSHISDSGFTIFLTKKPSILKILWNEEFSDRLNNELFVYNHFGKNNPYLPKLISYSTTPPKFLEIQYLKKFTSIGSFHEVNSITQDLLKTIIQAISSFHHKINSKHLKKTRNLEFYSEKLFKKDSGIRIKKYFNIDPKDFFEKLKNQKESIDNYLTFVLSDRNPTNILFNNDKIKLIDFDRSGKGNPAGDYTLLFLTLIPKYESLTELLIKLLKKNYKSTLFWNYFYLDTAFRCIDEYHFWKKNLTISHKIKSVFFKFYNKI